MRLAFHDCIPYQGGEISGGKGLVRSILWKYLSILIVVAMKVEVLMAAMAASTGKGWTGRGCSLTMRQKGARYVELRSFKEMDVESISLGLNSFGLFEIILHLPGSATLLPTLQQQATRAWEGTQKIKEVQ